MKHLIFSSLLLSFICTHTMEDDGMPTWQRLDKDIKKKMYEPCDRNLLATLLFGTNKKCYSQALTDYTKKREDAFRSACAKQYGKENLEVKVPDKPIVEVTFEELKKSLDNEPVHTPQTPLPIESKEFLACVQQKNALLFNRISFILKRDGNPSNW